MTLALVVDRISNANGILRTRYLLIDLAGAERYESHNRKSGVLGPGSDRDATSMQAETHHRSERPQKTRNAKCERNNATQHNMKIDDGRGMTFSDGQA